MIIMGCFGRFLLFRNRQKLGAVQTKGVAVNKNKNYKQKLK
jgi:hypothetical protein